MYTSMSGDQAGLKVEIELVKLFLVNKDYLYDILSLWQHQIPCRDGYWDFEKGGVKNEVLTTK